MKNTEKDILNSSNRNRFMQEVYSKYWIRARDDRYGFMPYDRSLCDLVASKLNKGSLILDVGIGTGYPIAEWFYLRGYKVEGIDIAANLIEECRIRYPGIKAEVGDAEDIHKGDGTFDAAVCFHSTWCIPDLKCALSEMLRVTKDGGCVVFDIMNADNPKIAASYRQKVREKFWPFKLLGYGRIFFKLITHRRFSGSSTIIHEVPSKPEEIVHHLKRLGIKELLTYTLGDNGNLTKFEVENTYGEYERIIFLVIK